MLTSKNGENGIRIAFSCPQDSPGARPHDVSKTPPDDPESILPASGGASFERRSADTAEERFKRAGAVKMAFLKISGNAEERFKRAGAIKMALGRPKDAPPDAGKMPPRRPKETPKSDLNERWISAGPL